MMWRPVMDPVLIVTLGLALATLAVWAAWRQPAPRRNAAFAMLAMRIVLIAAITIMLSGPSRAVADAQPGAEPRRVRVLLDTSRSMALADASERSGVDQFLAAPWLAEASITAFDAVSRPLPPHDRPRTDGDATAIVDALADALRPDERGLAPAAIVLVSDGRDTTGRAPDAVSADARAAGVPIHSVRVGQSLLLRDAAVTAGFDADVAFVNEPIDLHVTVHHVGLTGEAVELFVSEGGRETRYALTLDSPRPARVVHRITPDAPGWREVHLRLEPPAGDARADNNTLALFLDVTDQPIRVLLLEGEPGWDTKFLALALRGDERIRLTQMTYLTPQRIETLTDAADPRVAWVSPLTRAATRDDHPHPPDARVSGLTHATQPEALVTEPIVPETLAELQRFDLVILGRQVERVVGAAGVALLEPFVRQGGHVLLARGRAFAGDGVQAWLPVRFTDGPAEPVVAALTPAGRVTPWLAQVASALNDLPALTSRDAIVAVLPGARVLLAANDDARPVLATMPHGRGSATVLGAEGWWRWRLLPPRLQEQRGLHDALWGNLVRAAVLGDGFAPGAEATLRVERGALRRCGEQVIEALLRTPQVDPGEPGEPVLVTVTGPSGAEQTLTLAAATGSNTRFVAAFSPREVGVYRVALTGARERRFVVHEVDVEMINPAADPAFLRFLAERTGGVSVAVEEAERLAEVVGGAKPPFGSEPQGRRQAAYVWDRFGVMVVVLGWVGVEWIARRRSGLA